MKKFTLAVVMALVVLTTAADCEWGKSSSNPPPAPKQDEITSVTGTLISSGKSKGSALGYKKWKTGWFGGPSGGSFDVGPGTNTRVAGFCAAGGTEVEGDLTSSFGFTFGFSMKPGDCKRLTAGETARITVKKS